MALKLRSALAATILLACGLPPLAGASDLDGIYSLAVENDPGLRAAQAALDQSREALPQAHASASLPVISLNSALNGGYQHAPNSSDPGSHNYSLGFSLSQPLLHLDRQAQVDQAINIVSRAEATYIAAEQALMSRVAEHYFDILAAIDSLDYAVARRNAISRQLDQARKRFEVGLIAITDVHEAQAGYDLATADEIAASDQLASTREALAEITGKKVDSLAPLGDALDLARPQPDRAEAWADTASRQNPSILASLRAEEAARNEIRALEGSRYPAIDLTANHRYLAGENISSAGDESWNTTIGIQLSVPLFTGGSTDSKIREARARHRQRVEELEQVRRSVLRQTRDAYRGVIAAISRVDALAQALVSTQSALEATEAGFEVGTRTVVDVLNSQRDLHQARRDHARARYDYLINTLRLRQAAGILSSDDISTVNQWLKQSM
jgi:outer membrane protein